jgi:hypothetical protein
MKKYIVQLSEDERSSLEEMVRSPKVSAAKIKRARILLAADSGLCDEEIVDDLGVGIATVERVRKAFVLEGLVQAIDPKREPYVPKSRLDGAAEAHLVHLACSQAPEGYARWTLRLLANKLVELQIVDGISHETVRQTLKKTNSNLGARSDSASRPKKMRASSQRWNKSSTSISALTMPTIP